MSEAPQKIYLASDHAGFEHKTVVLNWLQSEGYKVCDCGPAHYDKNDDYPDFISLAAEAVSKTPTSRAVIFGASGQGEAMVANRYRNVRATVYYGGPKEIITLSRQHNDANVLSIGARFVDENEAMEVIWDWLHQSSQLEERHVRRIKKIEAVTKH